MVNIAIPVIIFMGILVESECLKCYVCPTTSINCQDPFNMTGSHVATTSDDSCVKYKIGGLVTRMFGANNICDTIVESCHTCSTDLCNDSATLISSVILVLVAVTVNIFV